MLNTLLWTLSIVGFWNAVNMVARIIWREYWGFYIWHVLLGAWAAILLWRQ